MAKKKGKAAERLDSLIAGIKNPYVKGFLIFVRFKKIEFLLILIILMLLGVNGYLKDVPYVGKIFENCTTETK